jgi:hypothetical protein
MCHLVQVDSSVWRHVREKDEKKRADKDSNAASNLRFQTHRPFGKPARIQIVILREHDNLHP